MDNSSKCFSGFTDLIDGIIKDGVFGGWSSASRTSLGAKNKFICFIFYLKR
jgi:hypothetical protein